MQKTLEQFLGGLGHLGRRVTVRETGVSRKGNQKLEVESLFDDGESRAEAYYYFVVVGPEDRVLHCELVSDDSYSY